MTYTEKTKEKLSRTKQKYRKTPRDVKAMMGAGFLAFFGALITLIPDRLVIDIPNLIIPPVDIKVGPILGVKYTVAQKGAWYDLRTITADIPGPGLTTGDIVNAIVQTVVGVYESTLGAAIDWILSLFQWGIDSVVNFITSIPRIIMDFLAGLFSGILSGPVNFIMTSKFVVPAILLLIGVLLVFSVIGTIVGVWGAIGAYMQPVTLKMVINNPAEALIGILGGPALALAEAGFNSLVSFLTDPVILAMIGVGTAAVLFWDEALNAVTKSLRSKAKPKPTRGVGAYMAKSGYSDEMINMMKMVITIVGIAWVVFPDPIPVADDVAITIGLGLINFGVPGLGE